jgi:elongation factor P
MAKPRHLRTSTNRSPASKLLASRDKMSMLQPENRFDGLGTPASSKVPGQISGKTALKVIASSIRKGNVIEQDGKLYVVLTAENIHPGKGTPVSQIEMRRIGDGVKISERYKTTDQVEKATVEDHNFNYLYEDADGFHFMNAENYDQLQVSKEIVGSAAPYLQENMTVKLSLHEGNPVAIQMPQRATLEVVETEPVTKGQTASSSYKPAVLSNGVRTAVPPHITAGTRIVVMTEDGSYVERAKD